MLAVGRATAARSRKGVPAIYVLINPAWPAYVKVGITGSTKSARLTAFNVGDPFRAYSYAAFVPVADARKSEKLIHDTLRDFRVYGEWFHLDTEAAVRLAESLLHRRHK